MYLRGLVENAKRHTHPIIIRAGYCALYSYLRTYYNTCIVRVRSLTIFHQHGFVFFHKLPLGSFSVLMNASLLLSANFYASIQETRETWKRREKRNEIAHCTHTNVLVTRNEAKILKHLHIRVQTSPPLPTSWKIHLTLSNNLQEGGLWDVLYLYTNYRENKRHSNLKFLRLSKDKINCTSRTRSSTPQVSLFQKYFKE